MSAPAVDVVVVTRDTRELTLRCVESVLAADSAGEARVTCTVVDNASADGTAKALADRLPGVRVIRNARNAGYGAACNQGLADGAGEVVLILNSDVYARPGAIGRLAGFLAAASEHVAAGGRLVDPGTDSVQVGHNVRAFPSLMPQARADARPRARAGPQPALARLPRPRPRLLADPGRRSARRLLPRRAAEPTSKRSAGSTRASTTGTRTSTWRAACATAAAIAYVHDATFEHVGGATFAQWDRPERILSWYPGLFRYFARHRPRWEEVVLAGAAAVLGVVRAVVNLPRHRERARACWRVAGMAVRGVPSRSEGRKTAGL